MLAIIKVFHAEKEAQHIRMLKNEFATITE